MLYAREPAGRRWYLPVGDLRNWRRACPIVESKVEIGFKLLKSRPTAPSFPLGLSHLTQKELKKLSSSPIPVKDWHF